MKGDKAHMPGKGLTKEKRYLESCTTRFWQDVFRAEAEYLALHLRGSKAVLSVGCGPAIVEGELSRDGYCVTGLDVSQEALGCAPDNIRAVFGRAEDMPFPKHSFDAVIYIASLQFMEDYAKAIDETARVLKPEGKLIAMLLNPESAFFKSKMADAFSYVRKIRHTRLDEVEDAIADKFAVQSEYYLGVKNNRVIQRRNPVEAVLYIIRGAAR